MRYAFKNSLISMKNTNNIVSKYYFYAVMNHNTHFLINALEGA